MLGELFHVDVLGAHGSYRSRSRATVADVTGSPVVELSLAPVPYVTRTMSALRGATTMPTQDRLAALHAAGRIFREGSVDGLTIRDHERLVTQVSGLGISTVRAATDKIARRCADTHDNAQAARPMGARAWQGDARREGAARWVRRGAVFGLHAAGNHPALHADWLTALALGYRVAVRPSRREPLTPYRLVAALRMAGFADDQVVFLPSEYDAADEMLRAADRSVAYGGDEVVRRYRDDPSVRPQGPGRSKILVTAAASWPEHLDLIVDSIARGGGTGCTNATAVLVEGDASPLADAIAERLSALPSLPPASAEAVLPVRSVEAARQVEAHVLGVAGDAKCVPGAHGIVDELGDGSAVLRPAVFLLDDASAPQLGFEMPFPCVWVAPWRRENGTAKLRDTLVLTVLGDAGLAEQALHEPSIRNVYVGQPTHWNAPGVPHDGYLEDFLMESKGSFGL